MTSLTFAWSTLCAHILLVACSGHNVTVVNGTGGEGANGDGGATSTGGTPGTGGTAISSVSCNLNGTQPTYTTPASGLIAGPNIDVTVSPTNANAYLEHTPGSYAVAAGYWVSINASTPSNSATSANFQNPTNATGGLLTVFVEVDSAIPGTYSSTGLSHCSGVAYCATLPIPSNVDCAGATGPACPAECSPQGSMMNPVCQPVTPELCYSADGAMGCGGETSTPKGSWSLTLESVTPCSDNPNPSTAITHYVVHGTLTASLIGESGDATDTATLNMTF